MRLTKEKKMSNWVMIQGDFINMDVVQYIRTVDEDEISLIFREDQNHIDSHALYFSDETLRDAMFEKIRGFLGAPKL